MNGEGRTAGNPQRTNEKLKVLSSVIADLGTGLFATAVARWFLTGLDGWALVWIVFGLTAIVVGFAQALAGAAALLAVEAARASP